MCRDCIRVIPVFEALLHGSLPTLQDMWGRGRGHARFGLAMTHTHMPTHARTHVPTHAHAPNRTIGRTLHMSAQDFHWCVAVCVRAPLRGQQGLEVTQQSSCHKVICSRQTPQLPPPLPGSWALLAYPHNAAPSSLFTTDHYTPH